MKTPKTVVRPLLGFGFALACHVTAAQAAMGWDESIHGDLSDDHDNPTWVALAVGSHDVTGSVQSTGGVIERDFFTITVRPGQVLRAIHLLENTSLVSAQDQAPVAIYGGTTAGAPSSPYMGLMGFALVRNSDIGRDLLPIMASSGAPPFALPLPAGAYSFLVQDASPGIAHYGLRLTVSSVPEPASAGLLLAGLAATVLTHRSRRRRPEPVQTDRAAV
jgi:hypothetical protein